MQQRPKLNLHQKNHSYGQLSKSHQKFSTVNKSFGYSKDDHYTNESSLPTLSNNDGENITSESLVKKSTTYLDEKPKISRTIVLDSLNHQKSLKKIKTFKRRDTSSENPIFSRKPDKSNTISPYKIRQKQSQSDEENWHTELSHLELELSNELNNISVNDDKYYQVHRAMLEKITEIDKHYSGILKKILEGFDNVISQYKSKIENELKQYEEKLNKEIAENKRLQKRIENQTTNNKNLLRALSLKNEEFSAFRGKNRNLTADEIEKIMDENKTITASLNLAQNEIRFLKLKECRYQKILQTAELSGYFISDSQKDQISDLSTTLSEVDLQQFISKSSRNFLQLPQPNDINESSSCRNNLSFDASPINRADASPTNQVDTSKCSDSWSIRYL
ncbi:unnamed protein product [Blepharisma stoltei]|uniref:Translin-associated factor X-interacting protein 1 N-terminal domain-containing protein n=1 Tax=Blepharisma stoltei TaxID=1481888 RepID=A0AAU9JAV1_9CILI|nr:unnamed protein product [Blepharisma stoltei]